MFTLPPPHPPPSPHHPLPVTSFTSASFFGTIFVTNPTQDPSTDAEASSTIKSFQVFTGKNRFSFPAALFNFFFFFLHLHCVTLQRQEPDTEAKTGLKKNALPFFFFLTYLWQHGELMMWKWSMRRGGGEGGAVGGLEGGCFYQSAKH